MTRSRLLILAVVAVACGELPAPAVPDAGALSYYSDYFSFVGEDEQGKVAFALDNNRGQDGDAFQAEHFVVMHDARSGWIDVRGNGFYPNPNGVLTAIPDSPFFRFSGAAEQGIVINSDANALTLVVSPIRRILVRQSGSAIFWLGSAAATLTWNGRVLQGRVIYEYLHRPDYNRLTRKKLGQWNNFHGLYLSVAGGGDLYLHSQKGADEGLTGRLVGFAVIDGNGQVLEAIDIEVPESTQAIGFFRWPDAWRGAFSLNGTRHELQLRTMERKNIANWVIGGFAMSIVRGDLRSGDRQRALYGFGELII